MVTAVDVSPNVMPTQTHPNCRFLGDDAERDLGLGNSEFDYIQVLHGLRDLRRFIMSAFEALCWEGTSRSWNLSFRCNSTTLTRQKALQ